MAHFKAPQGQFVVEALGQQQFKVDEQVLELELQPIDGHHYLLKTPEGQKPVYILQQGLRYQIWYQGEYYELEKLARASSSEDPQASNRLLAPLTGKVIQVQVEVGQQVEKGQSLLILESMKMETVLAAPMAATVVSVLTQVGEAVRSEQLLVELEPLAESSEPAKEA